MIKQLIFEAPINNLSLGNVSLNILKSLYKKGIEVLYSPIGNPDISNFKLSDEFKLSLQNSANRFLGEFNRKIPTLRSWHLSGSQSWCSDKRYLLTYHECDQATKQELNICKNIDKVFFCGSYSPNIFKEYGADNIDTFNLGFDSDSFSKLNKTYFTDGRINWGLFGKSEARKASLKILSLWAKKYGKKQNESYKAGEQQHFLSLCIHNPFYDTKIQEQQIAQALGGQRYINIQFFPFLNQDAYNDIYNMIDIDLTGLSLSESWNLPAFNTTCLSKWSIVLNAHGHKTWATKDNAILVNPSGKVKNVDNIFFFENSPFNVGNFYFWSDEDVSKAMDIAVTKAKTPNIEGEKLKETFSYDKTVDYVLGKIEEDLNKK